MKSLTVLGTIWGGNCTALTAPSMSPVERILKALLPVKNVCLTTHIEGRTITMSDCHELAPGVTVGDVVEEELDVEVPYGSMVIIHHENLCGQRACNDDLSYSIGQIVGDAIIDAGKCGKIPLAQENQAIYLMAKSYATIAQSIFLRDIGLNSDCFLLGMGNSLCRLWCGVDHPFRDVSGIFLSANFIDSKQLLDYLGKLDPLFAAPFNKSVNGSMMLFHDSELNLPEWMDLACSRVSKILEKVECNTGITDWPLS